MGRHVHILLEINEEDRMGVCAKCGPCGLVQNGRGMACNRRPGPAGPSRPRRASSLGPKHRLTDLDEGAKTATCSECGAGAAVRSRRDLRSQTGVSWFCLTPGKKWPKYGKGRGHGLSEIERQALIAEANGLCAICGAEGTQIDHDHLTGFIRGVLCKPCNLGLGCFKDDQNKLSLAVNYLSTSRRTQQGTTVRLADFHGPR